MALPSHPGLPLRRHHWVGFAALSLLCCTSPPVPELCPAIARISEDFVGTGERPQLDILFVIDNSGGMVAKQQALVATFRDLLLRLDYQGHERDYHVGITTTDVGSWVSPGQPWTMSTGACDSFAGDDGQLQAGSCLDRQNSSAIAAQTCSANCPDRRFVPTDGALFLSGYRGFHNVPVAMELDPKTGRMVDRGPEYALRCMALVGDGGCALSSPLEAMKRALDGHLAGNRGFLREHASLLVVIITDKDDCSVQLARRAENDPHTRNCSGPDADAAPECFTPSFRCLARNLRCDQPLNSAGRKTNCQERPDSYLEPVQSYVNFLQALRPQGRFAVVGLWPLPAVDAGGQVVVVQDPKVAGSAGLGAAAGPEAACLAVSDPSFVGQPQLRLTHFAAPFRRLAQQSTEGSVCEPQNYFSIESSVLFDRLFCYWRLVTLPGPPKLREDGTPACRASEVSSDSPHDAPETLMPLCGAGCCTSMDTPSTNCGGWNDEVIAACRDEPQPCYCIVSGGAKSGPWEVRAGLWRPKNADDPPGTIVNLRCALQSAPVCTLPPK